MNSAHSIKTCLSMAYLSLKTHRFIPIYSHSAQMGINGNDFTCKSHHFRLNLQHT